MSTQDIQNLYKLINDLRVLVGKWIGESKVKDDQFEKHIEKDDEWKKDMVAQMSAIANALLQDQTHDNAVKETKKELSAKWWAAIAVVSAIIAGCLPVFLQKWIQ